MPIKQEEEKKDKTPLQKKKEADEARIAAQDAAKKADRDKKMEAAAKKAVKKQTAKDDETARLRQLATTMDQTIMTIVSQVRNLRKTVPNCNAGDSGIQGGSKNPIALNSAALRLMKYQSNYDTSFSAVAKFRIKESGQSDILIHVTPVQKP